MLSRLAGVGQKGIYANSSPVLQKKHKEKCMLADLILNILGPIGAKRYGVVRKALWVVLGVFFVFFFYGLFAS